MDISKRGSEIKANVKVVSGGVQLDHASGQSKKQKENGPCISDGNGPNKNMTEPNQSTSVTGQ